MSDLLVPRLRSHVHDDFLNADVAHDIGHLDRVAALSGRISRELGSDPVKAQVAAYVHDYHRLEEATSRRRPVSPEEMESAILKVLRSCGVPPEWHPLILRTVELTGRYRFAGQRLNEECQTAAAVHDADNLDAMGAVGIGRAFAFGGVLGEPLWDPYTGLMSTYQEGETSSVLAHLYEKLVRLEDDMLTVPGRRMAADRAQLLHAFAAEFRTEWAGAFDADSLADGDVAEWDPRTRFLRFVAGGQRQFGPGARIGFRGQVSIGFSQDQRLIDLVIDDPPAMLSGPRPSQAQEHGLRIEFRSEAARHRLSGRGDAQVLVRDGRVGSLALHLLQGADQPLRAAHWKSADELS